jgi:hypothetical protein
MSHLSDLRLFNYGGEEPNNYMRREGTTRSRTFARGPPQSKRMGVGRKCRTGLRGRGRKVGEAEKGRWGKELGHLCINPTRVTTSPDPNDIEIVENVHPNAHTGLECVRICWNVQGAARLLNRGKMMLAPQKKYSSSSDPSSASKSLADFGSIDNSC